jgi:hypothetical protein
MSTDDTAGDRVGPLWPQLSALAKLPQRDFSESFLRQHHLDFSSEEGTPFEYAPIETNQIRLLMLIPATSRDSVLEAMIFVSNFPSTSLAGWHALSYTWGNADELPGLIIINGRKMKITANLEMALRDVRNEHAVPYWVDAICINQADPDEKAHQIRHMRYIYEKADGVRVWLGDTNEQIEEAMGHFLLYNFLTDEDVISTLSENDWSNFELDGLVSLFSRPYWKRIWIVQELVCGGTVNVYCGQRSVPLNALLRIGKLLADSWRNLKRPVNTVPGLKAAVDSSKHLVLIETTRKMRSKTGTSGVPAEDNNAITLWGLLQNSRDHQATNARDKVYALLGLVEDMNWCCDLFPIDYRLSVEQLYRDTARWIIIHSENLNLLCGRRSLQPGPSSYNLPSWCPDWTTSPQTNSLLDLSEMKQKIPLDLWKKAIVSFGPEEHSMTVTGVCIGTCQTMTGQFQWGKLFWYQFLSLYRGGEVRLGGNYTERQTAALERWVQCLALSDPALGATVTIDEREMSLGDFQHQKCLLTALQDLAPQIRDEPAIDTRLEMLWRTLVLDLRGEENESMKGFRSMFNSISGWNDKHIPADLATTEALLEFTRPFRRRVAECGHGRQLAFTERGNIEMVPVEAQAGDLVCTLFGCLSPLVLRPHESHYIVIGDAYVNGYMSLEAVREMELGELELRTFVLH